MNSIGYVKKNEDKARKTTRGFLRYKTSYSYNRSTHPNANYFFSSIFGGNFSYMFFSSNLRHVNLRFSYSIINLDLSGNLVVYKDGASSW